jgi:hypothetical protein
VLGFETGASGRPSWEAGPFASQGFIPASNELPRLHRGGLDPQHVAAYGDLELQGLDGRWTAGAAARVEHFDLFGNTTNGKLSFRYALDDAVSVRDGVSTGFRVPTPGQQNALNVQTTIDPETLELVESATVPSTFQAAGLQGGRPLGPEKSFNSTRGLVVDTGPFTLTADYFRFAIDDRPALAVAPLTLTPEERALLLSEGITSVGNLSFFRFLVNDFSTRAQGIDLRRDVADAPDVDVAVPRARTQFRRQVLAHEVTPSGARRARRSPAGSVSARASPTSRVMGIGHSVPSPIRMSAQTEAWSREVMNPVRGENSSFSSSSRSQSWRGGEVVVRAIPRRGGDLCGPVRIEEQFDEGPAVGDDEMG